MRAILGHAPIIRTTPTTLRPFPSPAPVANEDRDEDLEDCSADALYELFTSEITPWSDEEPIRQSDLVGFKLRPERAQTQEARTP